MGCTSLGYLLILCINFFHSIGLYIPSLQLKIWVCPCHTVLLLTVLYSPWLSSFYSWVRYPLGIYFGRYLHQFPSLKSPNPLFILTDAVAFIAQDLSQFWYLISATLNAQTGKKFVYLLSPTVGFTLNLACCLYNTLFIHCKNKNTSWKFQ